MGILTTTPSFEHAAWPFDMLAMDLDAPGRPSPLMASLPMELLLQIFSYDSLTSNDRANISLTSRRIYDIIHPILYSRSTELERALCLFLAAKSGRVDSLQLAQDFGADINCQAWFNDKDSVWFNDKSTQELHTGFTTPLHVAAKYGQDEAAGWLLDRGANIDVPSKHWCDAPQLKEYLYDSSHTSVGLFGPYRALGNHSTWTPLFAALNEKRTSTVELLVSRGANVTNLDAGNPDGVSAIHLAAANGMNSIIRLLSTKSEAVCILSGLQLPKAFNINSTHRGNTALHYACQYWPKGRPKACAKSSAIPLLFALGADSKVKDYNGESALTLACKMGNFQAATLLVKAGADPNVVSGETRDFSHLTPLQLACQSWTAIQQENGKEWYYKYQQTLDESGWDAARTELIEALVAAGATVGDSSDGGMHTILLRFCLFQSPRTASALLRLGVAVADSVNDGGQTVLLRYLRLNSPAVCVPQNLVTIRLLLDHGARLDMPDREGLDVLQLVINWFVENSKWSIHLRTLLEHAKDTNVSQTRIKDAFASIAKDIDPEALKRLRSSWAKRTLRSSSDSMSEAHMHEHSPQQARRIQVMSLLREFRQATWGHDTLP